MRCRRAVVLASRPQPSFINASAVAQPKQRRLPNVLRQSLEAAADGRITPTPQQVRAFRGAEQDVEATGYRRDITDVAQGCPWAFRALGLPRDGVTEVELATCVLGIPCSGLLCRGLPRRAVCHWKGRPKRLSDPSTAPPRSSRKAGFAFLHSARARPPGLPKRTFERQAGPNSSRQQGRRGTSDVVEAFWSGPYVSKRSCLAWDLYSGREPG